jgi:hypothetical protein
LGRAVGASRVETRASLSLLIARHGKWLVVREAWLVERGGTRASDATHARMAGGGQVLGAGAVVQNSALPAFPRHTSRRGSQHPDGPTTTMRAVNCCDVDSNSHHRAGASASHPGVQFGVPDAGDGSRRVEG